MLTAPGPLLSARLWAVRRGDEAFERYTVLAILITPSVAAGINRVPAMTYNIVNLITALVWSLGLGLGAYLVGPPVIDIVSDLGSVTEAILAVVVVIGVAEGLRRWLGKRRRRREHPESADVDPTNPSETS